MDLFSLAYFDKKEDKEVKDLVVIFFGILFFCFSGGAESPQIGAFEVKFGPYYPNIDSEFKGAHYPYRDTFGSDDLFLTQFELDWQFLAIYDIATVGIGGVLGFMWKEAKARFEGREERSGEETSITILPLALQLVLRFDMLAERGYFPLVLYGKFGLNYYVWWIENQRGIAKYGNDRGEGGTYGYQFSPGVMLRLDEFEPRVARTFDNEIGVNHSYIFFEFLWAKVEGHTKENVLRLSDNTYLIGLAFEF
jgi:hypothetical protein